MEISKELFENVMGIKLGNVHNTEQELLVTNEVAMFTDIKKTYKLGHPIDTIGIHELAHKCKIWAFNNGFSICVYNINDGYKIEVSQRGKGYFSYKSLFFDLEAEPEEIFKACQWILDNKIKG